VLIQGREDLVPKATNTHGSSLERTLLWNQLCLLIIVLLRYVIITGFKWVMDIIEDAFIEERVLSQATLPISWRVIDFHLFINIAKGPLTHTFSILIHLLLLELDLVYCL